MRRASWKFHLWLLRLPLWRYLLTWFAWWLVTSYAVTYADTRTVFGIGGGPPDNSLTFHLAWPATMTCVSGWSRWRERRRLADFLRGAEDQQP